MAVPTSIRTLLSGDVVEWARIEFKETWDAEASLKTVCAFANDIDNWGGGYIVVGVAEENGLPRRPLKGIDVNSIDRYLKDMTEKFHLIQPAYMPITEVVDYEDKKFIVIWCPGGETRPYSSPKTMAKNNRERVSYIRKNSSTIKPSDTEFKDLYGLANKVPFDDRVNHQAELSDINLTLIQSHLRETGSSLYEESKTMDFQELCSSMNLISVLPEYVKPKNIALLMFNTEPDNFFPYAQIDVVQFPNGVGGDDIVENIFKGPIQQQLRDALRFIRNNVLTEKVKKIPGKAEADRYFNYPYEAIEEALSNAVYHKGYDEREPIEVRIESDMIEIVSFPGPDRSVTIEGLKKYKVTNRRYRNRRIGEFLKELHLTEGRNTGFRKIINAIKVNGSPMPEFETDEEHNYFISRFFIHEAFHAEPSGETDEKIQGETKEKPRKNQGKTRERIVDLMIDNPNITEKEIGEILNLSRSGVEYQIRNLKKSGEIDRIGSVNGGHWVVKTDEKL